MQGTKPIERISVSTKNPREHIPMVPTSSYVPKGRVIRMIPTFSFLIPFPFSPPPSAPLLPPPIPPPFPSLVNHIPPPPSSIDSIPPPPQSLGPIPPPPPSLVTIRKYVICNLSYATKSALLVA
jgi:hypothetical protein